MESYNADRKQIDVVFEMSLDLTTYKRQVYNLIDLIADIGGLTSSCLVVFQILMTLVKYRDLEWYLVSKLFKAKELIVEMSSDSDMHSQDSDNGTAS